MYTAHGPIWLIGLATMSDNWSKTTFWLYFCDHYFIIFQETKKGFNLKYALNSLSTSCIGTNYISMIKVCLKLSHKINYLLNLLRASNKKLFVPISNVQTDTHISAIFIFAKQVVDLMLICINICPSDTFLIIKKVVNQVVPRKRDIEGI